MKPVGIIANPNSGKDIRRLVSSASVFNDQEKANILKCLLTTMDSLGIEQVLMMPDPIGLARTVLRDTGNQLSSLNAVLLDFVPTGSYEDSLQAVETLVKADCACIITLGGDGTNRIVAKACEDIPLLPISAGTNNVFPYLVESTIAATAVSAIVRQIVAVEQVCIQMPVLELYLNGKFTDLALIDLVVVDHLQVGARAVWDPKNIKEIFLTRARPQDIGLSSIGGCLHAMPLNSGKGLHIYVGESDRQILAPITPGRVQPVSIRNHETFMPGESIGIEFTPCIIALDGEREIHIERDDKVEIKLNLRGPFVIDIDTTLTKAIAAGFLNNAV